MMTGALTSDGEPVLRLTVEGPAGARDIEALVDTGFNGGLTLSSGLIAALGLPEKTVMEVTLADGRVRDVQTYVGTVALNGTSKRVLIAESPTTPLVGTSLLWGFSLYAEFQADGAVKVDRLPPASE
ncbi:MAG: clan AA aspartic protease [Salinibacter sp.]